MLVHTSAANILISISYYIGRWKKDCASTVVCGRLAFSCIKMSGGHPTITPPSVSRDAASSSLGGPLTHISDIGNVARSNQAMPS